MDVFKQLLIESGWKTHFLDDGYGDKGWWAYKGDHDSPELETGLFDTEDAAVRVAVDSWPDEFAEGLGRMETDASLSADERSFLAHVVGKMRAASAPTA